MQNEPMLNIKERPPIIIAGLIILCFILMTYGPTSIRDFIYEYGLLLRPDNLERGEWIHYLALLTHSLLHGSMAHLVLNGFMLLIFGVAVMRGAHYLAKEKARKDTSAQTFYLIFFTGVLLGGLAQWVWWYISQQTHVSALGASGGVSALFAGAAWAMGSWDRMIKFGLAYGLVNVIMVASTPITGINMGWAAHLGGYVGGALLAPFFIKPNSTGLSIKG